MGAYDNPKIAQVDPNAMARGITQFQQSLNRAGGKILAQGQKSRKEAEANLDKKQREEASRMRDFDRATAETAGTAAEFDGVTNIDKQGGFGTNQTKITFEDEVGRNVDILRDQLDDAINALGQDATPRQIQQVTNEYTLKAKKFKGDLLMVKIGMVAYEEEIEKEVCLPMDFTGRPMRGYIFITSEGFDMDEELKYWVQKGLDFNQISIT